MRRVAVVLTGVLLTSESESLLRGSSVLQRAALEGEVVRNPALPESPVPELAFLAVDPRRFELQQGPLTVSALKSDPPKGSVCFHLTVGSLDSNGVLYAVDGPLSEDDVSSVSEAMDRLRTGSLTPLWGEGTDHALVWEGGSTENATVPFEQAVGRVWSDVRPEGEGEVLLRRFIDDSVNLLAGSDSNKRREDDDRPPLNVLWPWGQGRWETFPNLVLRRGSPVDYVSTDLRLEGLVRLFGYTHLPRRRFGRRLSPDLTAIVSRIMSTDTSVVVLDHIGDAVRHVRADFAEESLDAVCSQVLAPLIGAPETVVSVAALADDRSGLTLWHGKGALEAGRFPFDERVLDDKGLIERPLWKSIEALLRA